MQLLLVEFINLFGKVDLVEQFVCVAFFGGQNDAVIGQDAQTGAGMRDGLQRVFNLVQATFWRKDCCSGIVASRLGNG